MTAHISHTSVDCRDAYRLSGWWKQVLGYVDVAEDPNEAGDEECMILRPDAGHRILFIEVPEVKHGKNRLHFDLRPSEGTRDEELARLRKLGYRSGGPAGQVGGRHRLGGTCRPGGQ